MHKCLLLFPSFNQNLKITTTFGGNVKTAISKSVPWCKSPPSMRTVMMKLTVCRFLHLFPNAPVNVPVRSTRPYRHNKHRSLVSYMLSSYAQSAGCHVITVRCANCAWSPPQAVCAAENNKPFSYCHCIPTDVLLVWYPGSLNLLERSGPVEACNGLLFTIIRGIHKSSNTTVIL